MQKFLHEFRHFLSYPRDMRVLLITNLIYGLGMPAVDGFVGAYVMRNSNDVKMVVGYQLAVFTGIPFTFLLNGYLMRYIKMPHLYSVGMMLSGVSMALMMSLGPLNLAHIIEAGLLMGVASGLYWANRDFLALSSTNDSNRHYYYGLEGFFATNISIVVPLAVGAFIAAWTRNDWFGGRVNDAYHLVTLLVLTVSTIASIVIHQGNFENPPRTRFFYFRFHKLWMKLQSVAVLRGLTAGYLTTAPVMLIMRLVGKEGSLGMIQSGGNILSAVMLYIIGRTTGPKHRLYLYSIGLVLFLVGTIPNALFFNSTGVLIFMACLVLSQPFQNIAYVVVQMLVIDTVSAIEKRNKFAYLLNQEFAYYLGRASGCILFIVLAYKVSDVFALRYALPTVAGLQLSSAWLIRTILKDCNAHAPSVHPESHEPLFSSETLQEIPAETQALSSLDDPTLPSS
ncbi:MAG: hypothetical protein LV481_07920 [Methylacidiphilales bacterium]|nr:hypothetical protein [Candidatus Methylacidiphilales bacterium]